MELNLENKRIMLASKQASKQASKLSCSYALLVSNLENIYTLGAMRRLQSLL